MNDGSPIPHSPTLGSEDMRCISRSRGSSSAFMSAEASDALFQAQANLKARKNQISMTSKQNFALEQDVNYLDQKIGILVSHRMTLSQIGDLLDVANATQSNGFIKDSTQSKNYSNLFFLLQTEPSYIAKLARCVRQKDIDKLLQTVMFSLYGNQYETREEYLLLSMFEWSLKLEFEEASNLGSVLRANTAVTRLMTTYTRRGPGQEYLKKALSEQCNKLICAKDLILEVNPLKVYEEIINNFETSTGQTCDWPRKISMEEASLRDDVKAIVDPRAESLISWTTQFLDTIIGTLDRIPYGIRWICRQIRRLVRRRFPDEGDEAALTLVGGFFLLRFVNPAICTPQAYTLIKDKPNFQMSKNFTLIAKILQQLANNATSKKEVFMERFKGFIKDMRPRISAFFNDICDVEDFHETLELENYHSLIRNDLSLNITLNEISAMHELLIGYSDELFKSTDGSDEEKINKLKSMISELGEPLAKVKRENNVHIELSIFGKWQVETRNQELTISENESLYIHTKQLVVQLFRMVKKTHHDSIGRAIEFAKASDDIYLKQKAEEVQTYVDKVKVINYNLEELFSEVKEELVKIKNLQSKVENESEELNTIYEGICQKNEYLQVQLESYRQYLINARKQAVKGENKGKKDKPVKDKDKDKDKVDKVKAKDGIKMSHLQLEKDGIVVSSEVPDDRKSAIYYVFAAPEPGKYLITMYYKGREKPVKSMEIALEDLLEKQHRGEILLDLEYIRIHVNKTLHVLSKLNEKK